MKILLLSCPDATHPLFPRFSKSPQLGLSSLSAYVQDLAEVKIGDLVLRRQDVRKAVHEAMDTVRPDLVGISSMTFQYDSAKKIAGEIRSIDPHVKIVLGGYHASLAFEEVARDGSDFFDFLVRGEGEETFRELILALQKDEFYESVLGLSFKKNGQFHHNPARPVKDLAHLPLPDRKNRLWSGYHIHGKKFDHIESSRGCTLPCTFCCITQHYGKNYRLYDFDRVIEDVLAAHRQGTEELFFVDDNITLNPKRFEALCDALIEAHVPRMCYSTQGSIQGLYNRPELIEKMARANFNLVFLGIENLSPRNLKYYKKGDIAQKTEWVLSKMKKNRMMVMGGFILGSPEDTREDIIAQFDFMRRWTIDSLLVQVLTPYPGTPLTLDLIKNNYVVGRDYKRYSGFFANVRTNTLSSQDLDFLRWKYLPYYRNWKWLFNSVAIRRYSMRLLMGEGFRRLGEWVVEKMRILFRGEKYAFYKFFEKHINSNCFFGEKLLPAWPDENLNPSLQKEISPARYEVKTA